MELTLANIMSTATAFVQGRLDITTSEASFYANLAHQEVATRLNYRGLEATAISSTTSGENRVSLPSDFGYPISLSNLSEPGPSTYRQLGQRDAGWVDSGTTVVGQPTHYALYNSWMELYPSPDSGYSLQLRYYKTVPTMTLSTGTPSLDARWHMAIVYKTAEYLAQSRDDRDSEAANRARYLSLMGSTPTDVALRQQARGMGVRLLWNGNVGETGRMG
jgi:hypothetical protein